MADRFPSNPDLPGKRRSVSRDHLFLGLLLLAPFLLVPARTWADPSFRPPPGAEAFPVALQQRLSRALADKGPAYRARTRNLESNGAPRYSNRLLLETSPYLQQHAHNPVNWYPWGDEAFESARRRGVPVLVSIGYSTCHWCHVMEEESFDDPEVAKFLNERFVAIKVDRESRPDVDSVYMSAVQAMGIGGGWPLNVWVTPDRVPFFGGTYFPPEGHGDRPGFRQMLSRISEAYAADPERFRAHARTIARELAIRLSGGGGTSSSSPGISDLTAAIRNYEGLADDAWGGLRQRVKFPSSLPVQLLLRWHQRSGEERALAIATKSLDAMASGGINDHLGGGFHRYSTDPRWLLPHFEKMLYDQALLSTAYLEAWQQTGDPRLAQVIRSILDYVDGQLGAPGGGFYSATDADSARPDGEMEEGFFFTWTPGEMDEILGPALGKQVRAWYGVTAKGDVDGRSVLRTWRTSDELALELGIPASELEANLASAREQLLAIRRERAPPLRDEKIIVAWNGLAISAFARAAFALDEPRYLQSATRAAAFILEQMRVEGRLKRIWLDGESAGPAFLDDYAFLIGGLIDLYEAAPATRWIDEALALQAVLDRHYADPMGGYFRSADDFEILLARENPVRDGAIPSGNSVEALNLLRLAALTSEEKYRTRGLQILASRGDTIRKNPTSVSELLLALDFALDTPKEILVVKGSGDDAKGMIDVLRKSYVPNRVISIVADGEEREAHAKRIPLLRYKTAQANRTTAYVCQNKVCKMPTTDLEVFASQLEARAKETLGKAEKKDSGPVQ